MNRGSIPSWSLAPPSTPTSVTTGATSETTSSLPPRLGVGPPGRKTRPPVTPTPRRFPRQSFRVGLLSHPCPLRPPYGRGLGRTNQPLLSESTRGRDPYKRKMLQKLSTHGLGRTSPLPTVPVANFTTTGAALSVCSSRGGARIRPEAGPRPLLESYRPGSHPNDGTQEGLGSVHDLKYTTQRRDARRRHKSANPSVPSGSRDTDPSGNKRVKSTS